MQQTQTQLETSLNSFRDLKNNLKEEFQDYLFQNNGKGREIPSHLELLLKELKNKNLVKQSQLQSFIKRNSFDMKFYSSKIESSQTNNESDQLAEETVIQKSLQQQEIELKKSINCIKKQMFPLQDYANQLDLQQKQAENECRIAEHESNRIKTMISELQTQNNKLKYTRQCYRDNIYDKSLHIESQLKSLQQGYDIQNETIEGMKQTIKNQKLQIEDLEKQQYEKMEKSDQQRITIQNYSTLIKLYEYCSNQNEQLTIDNNFNSYHNSESESSGREDFYSDHEDSVISQENFFQTQVQSAMKVGSRSKVPTPKKIKKAKPKLTHAQLMQKFLQQKELLGQIRNDLDLNIMEQIILNNFQEQSELQRQLTEQHQLLQEQKDEYLHELQTIDDKLNQSEELGEKLLKCYEPAAENFNQKILTKKIAFTSNENELQIQKQTDKLIKLESLFFTLNTKAMSLLKRICSILQNIQQLSDKLDAKIINIYQGAALTVGLLRQNNEFDLSNFPKLKKLLKSNNLTLIYCDQNVFQEFCDKLNSNSDEELILNFQLLIEICMNKIATETQCIYEQISYICNNLKEEVLRLCNYGSLRSFRDLANVPLYSPTNNYNIPTMRKLKDYTDSKFSEVSSKKSQDKYEKKSLLADDFKFVIEQDEKSLNEDDIDEFYYQVKKELETKPSTKNTRIETANQTKTTLVYDQPQKNKMTEFFKSNSRFSQSLRRIQSQGQFIENQSKNFKLFLEQEQKHIELLSRMNRTGSTSAFQPTSLRPKSNEKIRIKTILPRTVTTASLQKSNQRKIMSSQVEKDLKRLENQMNRFQKLKII